MPNAMGDGACKVFSLSLLLTSGNSWVVIAFLVNHSHLKFLPTCLQAISKSLPAFGSVFSFHNVPIFIFTHICLNVIYFIFFRKVEYFYQSLVLCSRFFNYTFLTQFDVPIIKWNMLSFPAAAENLIFHLLQLTDLAAASLFSTTVTTSSSWNFPLDQLVTSSLSIASCSCWSVLPLLHDPGQVPSPTWPCLHRCCSLIQIQHMIYPEECSMCNWEECLFCCFWMECFVYVC